jgi:hypothetical protein
VTGQPSVDDLASVEHLLAMSATIGDREPTAGKVDNPALV